MKREGKERKGEEGKKKERKRIEQIFKGNRKKNKPYDPPSDPRPSTAHSTPRHSDSQPTPSRPPCPTSRATGPPRALGRVRACT
jgi:hypothetical protein